MARQFHIDSSYADALANIGLKDFPSVMTTTIGTPVSVHKDRDAVRFQAEVQDQKRELFLKRTFHHPLIGLTRDIVFGRRPQARPIYEYKICKQLESAGIPAMKAIGYGEHRRWGLPSQAFVIVEAVPRRMSVQKAWQVQADGRPRLTLTQKRRLIRQGAKLISRLHRTNFRWPDLVSKHIMLDPPPSDNAQSQWQIYLIDLERIYIGQSEKSRQRDLLSLLKSMPPKALTRTDRLRFAISYWNVGKKTWTQQKTAIQADKLTKKIRRLRVV
ncbi:MAG: hypothetical protein JSV03_13560 [Planctomycetota bacterium]|nr:MAG: hypothetical protein JSV03_13560 [Planctomycetota bacterium]